MAQRNTATLIALIERGRITMESLTRRERKAVEKSMSVSQQEREHQSLSQINQNEYVEVERKRRSKAVVKAEKIGMDWSFSHSGYNHLIKVIEQTFEGSQRPYGGLIIHKVTDNEAVLYEV